MNIENLQPRQRFPINILKKIFKMKHWKKKVETRDRLNKEKVKRNAEKRHLKTKLARRRNENNKIW